MGSLKRRSPTWKYYISPTWLLIGNFPSQCKVRASPYLWCAWFFLDPTRNFHWNDQIHWDIRPYYAQKSLSRRFGAGWRSSLRREDSYRRRQWTLLGRLPSWFCIIRLYFVPSSVCPCSFLTVSLYRKRKTKHMLFMTEITAKHCVGILYHSIVIATVIKSYW